MLTATVSKATGSPKSMTTFVATHPRTILVSERRGSRRGIYRIEIKMLTAIKLLHTVIWALLAGSILALPVLGVLRRFRWAAIVTGIVLLECGLLAVNGGRCPLTDLAARFTNDRCYSFDIYLPNWLAEYNKAFFGVLFGAGELVVPGLWVSDRRNRS